MDEKQLNDMLASLKAPAPSDARKAEAMNAALAAFDENIALLGQGDSDDDRLTDRNQQSVRRNYMQSNSHRMSGLMGGVALCALVAVLGISFFDDQVKNISSVSGINAGGVKNMVGRSSDTDKVYSEAIEKENELKAKEAEAKGGSSMPIPIGKPQDDALSIPPAAKQMAGDPLQEWRAKAEARRLSLESESAPPEEDVQAPDVVPMVQPVQPSNSIDLHWSMQDTKAKKAPAKDHASELKNLAQNMPASRDELRRQSGAAGKLAKEESGAVNDREAEKPIVGGRADKASAMPPAGSMNGASVSRLVAVPQPEPVVAAPPVPPVDYYQKQNYYVDNGRDSFPDFQDNPVKAVSAEPVSTFSIDVDTASYSFVRRLINQGQMPPKGAVRLEELINYFPYNYDLPSKDEDPFKPTVAVYKCPWKEDHKLVHIGIKGYDLTDKPKTNMVFLIDSSGSMNSPDKLPLAISSFKLALESLKPDDTVGIVTYAGAAGVVLEPTRVAEKGKILEALDRLHAGGSTAGGAGIEAAYNLAHQAFVKEGNNRVILATDGDFNVGINNPDQLKDFIAKKRGEGIFLSVLGFGTGNYQDTTMQALAQNGNGNAAYIDNLSEARKVLVQEAGATMFTIAKDVKIQVEFNPALVQEYRLIGYETRHLNREDFNNDKIDAGEIGAGHTVTAIYEITPVGATPVVDGLRYGDREKAIVTAKTDADKSEFSNELAFLKMRYKRPDSDTSKLMTRPITSADEKKWDDLSDDVRFAASVAGFGQLLRDSQYTNNLNWQQVIDMASNANGKDEFGYRAEFVNLLHLAKSQSGVNGGQPVEEPEDGRPQR